MKCRICSADTSPIHRAVILDRHEIGYHICPVCEFMQTDDPFWLEEAYSSAISCSDTGILSRNIFLASMATSIIRFCCDRKSSFLDFGGGYGIFTRLMRDYGFDFHWHDKYAQNLFAKGFEANMTNRYAAVTAFENFEHFLDPGKELETMLQVSDFILFSTELRPSPAPKPESWWYYCLEHGQHISFYTTKTLAWLAGKYGIHLQSNGKNIHIFSRKPVSRNIFLFEKIMRNSGLWKLLKSPSKTVSDMQQIISTMQVKK